MHIKNVSFSLPTILYRYIIKYLYTFELLILIWRWKLAIKDFTALKIQIVYESIDSLFRSLYWVMLPFEVIKYLWYI